MAGYDRERIRPFHFDTADTAVASDTAVRVANHHQEPKDKERGREPDDREVRLQYQIILHPTLCYVCLVIPLDTHRDKPYVGLVLLLQALQWVRVTTEFIVSTMNQCGSAEFAARIVW